MINIQMGKQKKKPEVKEKKEPQREEKPVESATTVSPTD